jgi:hypothetical protein
VAGGNGCDAICVASTVPGPDLSLSVSIRFSGTERCNLRPSPKAGSYRRMVYWLLGRTHNVRSPLEDLFTPSSAAGLSTKDASRYLLESSLSACLVGNATLGWMTCRAPWSSQSSTSKRRNSARHPCSPA